MIARILWSFILVSTLYVLAVFFQPQKADELGDVFGIKEFNVILREAKDGGAQDIKVNFDSGSGGYLWGLQDTVNETRKAVETTKSTIQLKVDQTKKAVDSVQNAAGAIEQAKNDISALTSLSGSSGSGAAVSASGKTSTGITASGSVRRPNSK